MSELPVATFEDIACFRAMLPYMNGDLNSFIQVMGEDGIRYTFLNRGNARGCYVQEEMSISFVSTMKSNGAKRAQFGFLWPLEQMVYARERRQIINDILANLERGAVIPRLKTHLEDDCKPYPEDFGMDQGADFVEDWRKAIDRTNIQKQRVPKVSTSTKLAIRQLQGTWWLLHRQWMPLCFDSFEEAAVFAKRYMRSSI